MAESAAIIGKGTTLSYSATSGGTYVLVAELVDVKDPELSVDKVDVTHYTSTGGAKEKKPGWIDGGDVEFELNYTKGQKVLLRAQLGVMNFWKITYPDASVEAFEGFIDKFGGEIPKDGKISNKVKVCVTGLPAFTAGS